MTTKLSGPTSMFILYENGTWEQPTLDLSRPATETEIARAAERYFGRRVVYVAGIDRDYDAPPDCPELPIE